MKKVYFIYFIVLSFYCKAQINYSILAIKPNLLKNVNAVKRLENTVVEIESISKATITSTVAVTVLNEKGADYASLKESYDKLNVIKNIDGYLYDAFGKKIKSLKNKDIKDFSSNSGSFYDDNRVKQHQFEYPSFPYTVEYVIERQMNGIFYLPPFIPIEEFNISVEKSSFTVLTPNNYNLRFKTLHIEKPVVLSDVKTSKQYFWELNSLESFSKEWRSAPLESFLPSIIFAPSDFEIQNFSGSQASWESFGQFISALNANRTELPENIILKVKDLVKNLKTDKEKVFAVYNYLQKNTRYISIQLGIGGWQTFPAKYVAEKGYGDCKALSNYMVSLLKAVDIKGVYTLIHAGERPQFFLPDFASNQFNHIIVNVPLQKDTIWLECTNQDIAPGYLGSFTANRYALMITENGGVLVKTPKYEAAQNAQIRRIEGTLYIDGSLKAKVSTLYCGEQQDDLQQSIKSKTKEQLLQDLNQNLAIASYDISDLAYTENNTTIPAIKEDLFLSINNFASLTGKRLYFTPNVYNKSSVKLNTDEVRATNICNSIAYKDIDSVLITIPNGYMVEAKMDNKEINSIFGSYKTTINITNNNLIYIRELTVPIGEYNKTEYEKIANWYKEIYKADRQMITFVKAN